MGSLFHGTVLVTDVGHTGKESVLPHENPGSGMAGPRRSQCYLPLMLALPLGQKWPEISKPKQSWLKDPSRRAFSPNSFPFPIPKHHS